MKPAARRLVRSRLLVPVLLAAATLPIGPEVPARTPPTPKEPTVTQPTPCPDELAIDRSDSPWSGYTRSYDEEQAGLHVAAAKLLPKHVAPKHLADFAIGGAPLLAIDRAARRVHVDARSFSDLERIDVTRLAVGERKPVGRVLARASSLAPSRLAQFLLLSQLVITYWHIGARVCPVKETTTGTVTRLSYTGVHEYCTNECSEDSYAFAIEVDRATGAIVVVGE